MSTGSVAKKRLLGAWLLNVVHRCGGAIFLTNFQPISDLVLTFFPYNWGVSA